jgi:hypothetical protein
VYFLPLWFLFVGMQLSIGNKTFVQAKPEDTLDLSRLLNDDLAAKVRTNPHRLVSTVMFYSLSILEKYKWNISSFRNYLEKFRVSCVRPEL